MESPDSLNHKPTLLQPDKSESIPSIDYTLNPPKESQHHKSPSVHAHFYVEETLRPVRNRSRSGSNSNNNLTPITSPQHSEPSSILNKDAIKSQESLRATTNSISSAAASNQSTPRSIISGGGGANTATSSNSTTSNTALAAQGTTTTTTTNSNSNTTTTKGEQNSNIDPRLPQDDGKFHVLIGVCGALSVGKVKLIVNKLLEIYTSDKISIQVILTKSSENFLLPETLNVLENVKKVRVWTDIDEWTTWKTRSDPVLHIELRRWADILLVCPLTANTLAKISLGICDNLLTNVIRAWNSSYPILLAPAMDSHSYSSSTTKRQLRLIADDMPWIEVLKPSEKVFGSYGDIGMGGMTDWNEIVNRIVMK
ncbi:Protein SIS2, partial [Candida tropicalis]